MLEIIFLSDGKISDTNIPYRISKEISYNSTLKFDFTHYLLSQF